MVRLLVLGSASLVSTEGKRPTQLACIGRRHGLLIDCGVSPRGRLEALGVGRDAIDDVFITHFHPDHAAGLPLFLMELALRGRRKPIRIHSGRRTLARIRRMMDMYRWRRLPSQFPIRYRPVDCLPQSAALANEEFRVSATPVRHVVPALAVRVDLKAAGASFVYSSDTEPSGRLARLARGTDLLIHEATGAGRGHSSAAQAGEVATRARAARLLLIHTNPYADDAALLRSARTKFSGRAAVARDRMRFDW